MPIRGCTHNTVSSRSVVEFDCQYQKRNQLIPGTPRITMTSTLCKDYRFEIKKISRAINIFISRYSAEFNIPEESVVGLLNSLEIEVSAIPKVVSSAYDITGKFLTTKVPVSGLAISKNKIWVEVKTSQIWSSSLVHELIHIIIWRSNGVHGDPDHEGKQFSGWKKKHSKFIKRINLELLELDL